MVAGTGGNLMRHSLVAVVGAALLVALTACGAELAPSDPVVASGTGPTTTTLVIPARTRGVAINEDCTGAATMSWRMSPSGLGGESRCSENPIQAQIDIAWTTYPSVGSDTTETMTVTVAADSAWSVTITPNPEQH
jgi:hypothetical protein